MSFTSRYGANLADRTSVWQRNGPGKAPEFAGRRVTPATAEDNRGIRSTGWRRATAAAMRQATAFHFGSSAKVTARREFAVAFTVVLALHAALAVWMLRSRERPMPPPEPPRTIVARLLSAAPVAPLAPAATPAQVPPREAAAHAALPPAQPKPAVTPKLRAKPPAVHREMPAPTLPVPPSAATQPAPSATVGAVAHDTPTPATTAPAAQAAQPSAPSIANAVPKEVSHVDCNIAQPDYPEAARRRGESGTAVVRFVVGVDGRVESARIQQSSGSARLDDAALGALHGSACRPWKEAGVPVRVAYAQPFVFGLGN